MSDWRVRQLITFPESFHAALQGGIRDDKFIWEGYSLANAMGVQREFRIFLFSARKTKGPLQDLASNYYHRTRRVYIERTHRWQVLLTTKPSALSDLKNPEVLGDTY